MIAGSGPVGSLMAMYLAKREVPVLVLEKEPELPVDLRASTFHLPSLEMIEHADLSDDENFMKFLDMLRQTFGASIESLMTCKPDHVMMGMSVETFWGGVEGSVRFEEGIREHIGEVGLTTGATATREALDCFGAVFLFLEQDYGTQGFLNYFRRGVYR